MSIGLVCKYYSMLAGTSYHAKLTLVEAMSLLVVISVSSANPNTSSISMMDVSSADLFGYVTISSVKC